MQMRGAVKGIGNCKLRGKNGARHFRRVEFYKHIQEDGKLSQVKSVLNKRS